MAIRLSDNIKISVGAPIDNKYLNENNAPYTDVTKVIDTIGKPQRYIGLTVNVNNVEYWFKDGVESGDLVIKSGGSGSGERIEKSINQVGHGFTIGDVIAYQGTSYIKAIADGSQNNIEVIGFVSEIVNNNEFIVVFAGYIDGLAGLGLDANSTYYLSTTISGKLDINESEVFKTVSKPILATFTNNDGLMLHYRGLIVTSGSSGGGEGGSSGITKIQNVGSGTGEIFETTEPSIGGETSSLRTLLGSGGTTITTVGDTVIINSDASGLYDLASPSNIEVGGIPVGTELIGKTSNEILAEMLIKTYPPTISRPDNTTLTRIPSENTFEVGTIIPLINFSAGFNRGDIKVQGVFQNFRSGFPNTYNYTGTLLNGSSSSIQLTDGRATLAPYTVLNGANTWSYTVSYDAGPQPLDSEGNPSGSPLGAGTTNPKSTTITGYYPWFYGKVSSGGAIPGGNRPIANQALIDSGTKVVASSSGTIIVNNFASTLDDYIWFAIPNTSPSVTKKNWWASDFSFGTIEGSVNPDPYIFPVPDVIVIDSKTLLWENIEYQVYISNVMVKASYMEFRT